MQNRERWLVCLALFVIQSGVAGAARAVPVVYTAGGQLGSTFTGDVLQFNGATVRLTMTADTGDAPAGSASIAGGIEARYRPSSGLLEITGRPGGAPDLAIAYTPDLVTVNLFEPSAEPDRFEIDEGSTTAVPNASQFFVGGFRVSFIDASAFPGSDPGPLPGFDLTGGAVVFGLFYDLDRSALYPFEDAFVESDVVPEPASALLVAPGLAARGMRARRRR
jgi:hypothetical protein